MSPDLFICCKNRYFTNINSENWRPNRVQSCTNYLQQSNSSSCFSIVEVFWLECQVRCRIQCKL